MNREEIKDWVTALIALGLILYALWFVLAHSPQFVTYADMFTVWGTTIGFLFLLFNKLDKKIGKLEDKINDMIKEFSYFRGKMNGK